MKSEENLPQAFVDSLIKTCNNQQISGLAQASMGPVTRFQQYTNPLFTMDYPSDWEAKASDTGVTFVSQADHPYDKYLESVDLFVYPKQFSNFKRALRQTD